MAIKDYETMPWLGVVPPYDPFGSHTGPIYPTTTTDFTIGNIHPKVVAQGWECPKCQQVYAPHVEKCGNCGPKLTINWDTNA